MSRKSTLLIAFSFACVQAAASHAAGWSAPVAVSPLGSPDPTRGAQVNSIAVNGTGTALATWDQYFYTNGGGSTVGANVQTNGRWGTPVTISHPTKYSDRATGAILPDGTLLVAWASQEMNSNARTIEVAERPAGSTQWSTPTVLASGSLRVSPDPSSVRLAVNKTGEAWVAWSIFDGSHYVVQAAYRPAPLPGQDSDFGSPVTLTPLGEDGAQPALALNESGHVAIAWAGSPYAMSTSPNTITVAEAAPGATAFTLTRLTPDLNRYTGYLNSPAICMDASGLSRVTWFGAGIQAAVETPAETSTLPGKWTLPETVIPPISNTTSFISPSLACDDSGNAIAAATLFDATVGVQRAQVWASTLAGTKWSKAEKLTGLNPRRTEDIAASQAVMSPDGRLAFVAYVDHYNGVVKSIHRAANGSWGTGTPYTLGKTTNVASFAEVVNGDAASATQARVLWKTRGGQQHVAVDWRP
jgi:hypothetical protein